MTTKSILALSIRPETDESVLRSAGMIAEAFAAHLAVTHMRDQPRPIAVMGYEGIQPYVTAEFESEFLARADALEREARGRFDAFVARAGLALRSEPAASDTPSASWEAADVFAPDFVRRHGGAYDLIVAGRPVGSGSNLDLLTAETALFATGRPVLIAPPDPPARIAETVLIGWNRSGSAARAFHAAKALLLGRARKIRLLSVTTGAKEGPAVESIHANLAWHGIDAEVRELSPDYRSIGEVLLAEASAIGADLVVMGAYSHSRLRQMILGGVTQHVLTRAGVPVFMAH